jgi:Flp pilus assembly protein TadD
MRRVRGLAFFVFISLACVPTFAQVFQNDGSTPDTALANNGVRRNRYSMTGDVRSAPNDAPFVRVQVNIRSDDGQTFLATMTDDQGRFSFDNLYRGNYSVSVSIAGFQFVEERVAVENGPVLGVQLRPRSSTADSDAAEGSRSAISAHELTAPGKAREGMAKAMTLLYQKFDFQGAIRQFQKAIKEFPDYYEAYAQMGMAYMDLKDAANAETALRKSVALSGEKYPLPYIFMASLFTANQRFSDAEPMARKALDLDPNSWQAYSELTHALSGLNRLPEAAESAETAIKLDPQEPELYLMLINIENKMRNYPAMLDTMDAYLKLAPNGRAAEQVRTVRTQVLQAMGKIPAATPQGPATDSDNKP